MSPRWLVFALAPALLTACTFRAPQYDTVRGLVGALASRDEPLLMAEPESAWVYRLNGLEALFYAFEDEQGFGFVSASGAILRFDGFDLVSGVRLPNAVRAFTVSKEPGGRRVHDIDGFARYEMDCAAPPLEGLIRETVCEYVSPVDGLPRRVVHRLETDESGLARRMQLTLVPDADPLVMERLRDRVDEATFEALSGRIAPSPQGGMLR